MHKHQDTQLSPYSTQQLFDLVIDVARYPEFLPWCRAGRILEQGKGRLLAELVVSFSHFTESYVSEVTFQRPASEADGGVIDVALVRGPFTHLENHWTFTPREGGGATIALALSFQFRSKILDSVIGLLFGKACAKMVKAFAGRADALYGEKH